MPTNDHFLSVRLKPAEEQQLKYICKVSGLTPSRAVRRLIMGTEIRPRPPEGLREVAKEINAIGRNINQITKAHNSGFATENDKAELKVQMDRLERLVSEALR